MKSQEHYLRIDPKNNLIVALSTLPKDTKAVIEGKRITITEKIPSKHKFVSHRLEKGDAAIMYGVIVGRATEC